MVRFDTTTFVTVRISVLTNQNLESVRFLHERKPYILYICVFLLESVSSSDQDDPKKKKSSLTGSPLFLGFGSGRYTYRLVGVREQNLNHSNLEDVDMSKF